MDTKLMQASIAVLSVTGPRVFFGQWTFSVWVELAPRKFLPLPRRSLSAASPWSPNRCRARPSKAMLAAHTPFH